MSGLIREMGEVRVMVLGAEGLPVRSDRDAIDLIGDALGAGVAWAAIPAERLGEDFFVLSTRIAGDAIQKFVNYGIGLAVVGDISRHLAHSGPLRDFVYESNRGRHVWFVVSLDELESRLAAA
ncbi:MAG: DUF4180 domain-containing protein [Phenylobacterium sp.]|uniref:DUF4180 domain-containing protein n=1 Tax=Phenylobacterium sp. TaxID=1871053 RepID=UPI002733519E|nr:DUF4180 domain-containing protein [Phenylobacterium sp.]MDP3745413.1 DUF4180 domain-containing protein [Phenylobacterium sp.]